MRKRKHWLELARPIVQFGVLALILVTAIRHATGVAQAASLHALCPFGAVETLWTLITEGNLIQKIHPSALVLGGGLLIGGLVVGGAFCGWICPLGALQDALAWLRKILRLPEVRVPQKADRILRYGRYLTLAAVVYASAATARLWFNDYDPYHTIFSLGWIFEFDLATQWPAYAISLGVIVGGLFIPRLWCRYLCPLGGLLSLVQRVSPFKVRRNAQVCINCKRCDKVCPAKLSISPRPAVTHDCAMCLKCVGACPVKGALDVALPRVGKAQTKQEVAQHAR